MNPKSTIESTSVRDANRLLSGIIVAVDVNFEWFQRKYCGFKERIRI